MVDIDNILVEKFKSLKAQYSDTMVPANNTYQPLEGRNSTKIGGM